MVPPVEVIRQKSNYILIIINSIERDSNDCWTQSRNVQNQMNHENEMWK